MKKDCIICGSKEAETYPVANSPDRIFYVCPVCGRYEDNSILSEITKNFNLNQLGSYLAYNGFSDNGKEYRYFTTMNKEQCDEYKTRFDDGNKERGRPVHLETENVTNWYPKTFSEKVDFILLYLNSRTKHMGENITLSKEEMISSFFVDRYDYENTFLQKEDREDKDIQKQTEYMWDYLQEMEYVHPFQSGAKRIYDRSFHLQPKGYARIDILQKNITNGKNVLVAMKFGDDTKYLREAIRQGIASAEYVPIFIDEVEHNDFITPELLKHIRDSKFVVVDLSHQNNGAYFEEGYALGLGKPVIQLCKQDVQLHFDIAQKNTIIWKTEDEIAERLKNRILATID